MTSVAKDLASNPVFKEEFYNAMMAKIGTDTAGLIQDLRNAENYPWIRDAWSQSIELQHSEALEAVTELFMAQRIRFDISGAIDSLSDKQKGWVLSHPTVYRPWLQATKYSLPTMTWNKDLKRPLTHEESVVKWKTVIDHYPEAVHSRLQAYIKSHGMEALQRNGVFLEIIAYYQEPSKKQVKVAALFSQRPFWDAGRIEKYWPGANAVKDLGESLAFPPKEQLARLRKLLTVGVETEGTLELPTFE